MPGGLRDENQQPSDPDHARGQPARTDRLATLLIERDHGLPVDAAELRREIEAATDWVVRSSRAASTSAATARRPASGSRPTPRVRLSGWGGVSPRKGMTDIARFPRYGELLTKRLARPGELTAKLFNCFQCQRAVQYQPDLADAKLELQSLPTRCGATRGFHRDLRHRGLTGHHHHDLPARRGQPRLPDRQGIRVRAGPGDEGEYDYIVSRGHVLQLDAPDLAMERSFMFQGRPLGEFLTESVSTSTR